MSDSVVELFNLPNIRSDCHPWMSGRSVMICSGCGVMKRACHKAFSHSIYDGYISSPEPTGRTDKILEFIKDKIPQPKSVLDIGTGTGGGIKILSSQFPSAKVNGYDPHSEAFSEKPIGQFDLITLFHVLEHVEDIHKMLDYIKSTLNPNGYVLIQVPSSIMWPFDLIIADHCWHFNKLSLMTLLGKSGFLVDYIGNYVIKKEITVLAHSDILQDITYNNLTINKSIDWIIDYKKYLDTINEAVVIYGTGPAAAWTGNILGDKAICYLDDDESRHGEFSGKNVFPPVACRLPVVAPFLDWQLKSIKQNNKELKFL